MSKPYASPAQVLTVLESLGVDLTTDSGTTFDETKAGELLVEASNFINGYLSLVRVTSGGTVQRYTVPVPDSATDTRAVLCPHTINVFRALALGARLADNAVAKSLFDATVTWLTLVARTKDASPLPADAPLVDATAETTPVGEWTSNDVIYTAARKGML